MKGSIVSVDIDKLNGRSGGLTSDEVAARRADGRVNISATPPSKSVAAIFRTNLCTLFNLLNVVLALLVLSVGSYKNMLFMGVVLCNVLIGTFQELRAKHVIDRLSLISAPHAAVVRDGETVTIAVDDIVMDELMLLSSGNQVCADAVICDGNCEVNESLITGEAEPVLKASGDRVLSGSFIVSGRCSARVEHVGAENYAAKITGNAKFIKKPSSQILKSVNSIIKFVSILLIPLGLLLFSRQFFIGHETYQTAIVSTVAAVIGMIPEGLVLLTSVVLAVSVIRLARKNTLVQELYCIETLARVDVLCLDKTGTLTEGHMRLIDKRMLGGASEKAAEEALAAFAAFSPDTNPTMEAVRATCDPHLADAWESDGVVPFSSARKWSGVSFRGRDSFVMGAPSMLAPELAERFRSEINEYAKNGGRVMLFASFSGKFNEFERPNGLTPIALLVLGDKIRDEAPKTLRFFADQGVKLKVISGDDPVTVSNIARLAGLDGAEKYVDASTLSNSDLAEAVRKYHVFGRVTPDQKCALIRALRDGGATVAMTGDGVNDVPALREADCSIAMASGSDAARNVSQLVLLDSNFASLPKVVAEGRRSINNVQRSGGLFLTKTTYAVLLAVLFLFVDRPYPFQPIQLTLISAITIGIPSFVLALEPNSELVRGDFLKNILEKALPGGITIALNLAVLMIIASIMQFSDQVTCTIAVIITGCTALLLLLRICAPMNLLRSALWIFLSGAFATAILFFSPFFNLADISATMLVVGAGFSLISILLLELLSRVITRVFEIVTPRAAKK